MAQLPSANEMNSRVNHFMPSNSQLLDGQISRVGWSLRGSLFLLSSEVRHNSSRALNNNEARVNRFNLWDNRTVASISVVSICLPLANEVNGGVNDLMPSDSQFLDGHIGRVGRSFRGLLLLLSSEVWDHSSRAWNHNISRVDRLNLWNYSSIASITIVRLGRSLANDHWVHNGL